MKLNTEVLKSVNGTKLMVRFGINLNVIQWKTTQRIIKWGFHCNVLSDIDLKMKYPPTQLLTIIVIC